MTGDPRDTLVVTGGRGPSAVDTAAVRAASLRVDVATGHLRAAVGDCLSARTALDRLLWTPPLGVPDPTLPGRVHRALALVDDVVATLGDRAEHSGSLSARLLVAAGLYEDGESVAERLVGALVVGVTGVIGLGVTAVATNPALGLPSLVVVWGGVKVWQAVTDDVPDDATDDGAEGGADGDHDVPPLAPAPPSPVATLPTRPDGDGGLLGDLLRALAPYADEAITGAGTGVALGAPVLAREPSVTGGARVLSTLLDALMRQRVVTVDRVPPSELGSREPAWTGRPPGTVTELVARIADLYPAGNGLPGRVVPGVPPGSVAVQRIEHADGPDSWVVTVPGTQALVSGEHPFDVDTDLDLMAQGPEIADVMAGVVQALEDAGAAPDEPVVLTGHSLGGIAVTALAADPGFRARHRVAGVVTVGAPTATFTTPPGVPVLHVENTEELVSPLDGRSGGENPATADRVTLSRTLGDSTDTADRAASGSVSTAHQVATHVRTIGLARSAGNVQVAEVSGRIEEHLDGESADTRLYQVRRSRRED